jgi:hypothetical protein
MAFHQDEEVGYLGNLIGSSGFTIADHLVWGDNLDEGISTSQSDRDG